LVPSPIVAYDLRSSWYRSTTRRHGTPAPGAGPALRAPGQDARLDKLLRESREVCRRVRFLATVARCFVVIAEGIRGQGDEDARLALAMIRVHQSSSSASTVQMDVEKWSSYI
jgi:hypothetical protein